MRSEPDPRRLGVKGEPIVKGSETIYEIIKGEDSFGFGLALVRIEGEPNEAHYHERTREVYVVVWGSLEVRLADINRDKILTWRTSNKYVGAGHSLEIPRGKGHQARAPTFVRAWFYVFTFPPFSQDDYHPLI